MDDFTSTGVSFVQLSSNASRRWCEQSEGVARTIYDWNTEVGEFLARRVTQNLDTIARITKCGNFQEAFSIQAAWFRDTADEYAKEIGKLMEINGKIAIDALKPVQEAAVQVAERAPSSSAKVPMKVES